MAVIVGGLEALGLVQGAYSLSGAFWDRVAALNNNFGVLGYVIMRLAMLFQWLRAARADPAHRRACLTYAAVLAVTQLGWISQIILDLPVRQALLIAGVLVLIEMAGPILAERQDGGEKREEEKSQPGR